MRESKSVPGKFMIHRPLCLAAISVMTAAAFAQSVVSNRASSMATTAIENLILPAPAIFAPGVISGPGNDGTPTFSPDGRTLYFYRCGAAPDSAVILESHRTSAGWSQPVAAEFSGPSSDRQPVLSPDGHMLLYVSRRQLAPRPGESPRYASSLWR